MKIIIGLGNPEKKYINTRHNLGFEAIDEFYKNHKTQFSDFKTSKKFNAQISQGKINDQTILLLKPLTFMNLSGQAVRPAMKFYKIKSSDIWIIHDDIDIALAKIKISKSRSAAGHKGVQSIIDQLGTKDFVRFRMGIKTPLSEKIPSENFVLKKFATAEKPKVAKMIKQIIAALDTALADGPEKAMSLHN
ncbi:aminoacyl-tRNA hydrolase [Patescibacteria group bacterium]|nr:aminoacyl-tRNA hydrolase [Patescibacteria group bacterium]MBU1922245.1 aminoacyl-tRNA hydrolase [Patescibacteria group bacterium]